MAHDRFGVAVLVDSIVDQVGEALGVDTGTVHESRFDDAKDRVRKLLVQLIEPEARAMLAEDIDALANQAEAMMDSLQGIVAQLQGEE